MSARVDHVASFRKDVTVDSRISLPVDGERVHGAYSTFVREESHAAIAVRLLFTCSLHGWEPRG